MVKLCLNMIVKNESKIIERCIDSCKKIIDAIFIADTQSTDDTVEIIKRKGLKENIPTKVVVHKWENFGVNRSKSFDESRKYLEELGFDLDETYCLLLDADMLLEISSDFKKEELEAGGYRIYQYNNTTSYINQRLIKASKDWKCVSPTHEYWSHPENCNNKDLITLKINDIGDGGAKEDKFIRDIRLLKQGILEEPKNLRYPFYLAQSYSCINDFKNAIMWYKNKLRMDDNWDEEAYYSAYQIGNSYKSLGKNNRAKKWYMKAYNFRPKRLEAPYALINLHRNLAEYNAAMLYITYLLHKKQPNDVLFVNKVIEKFLIHIEVIYCAYYTKNLMDGAVACEILWRNRESPPDVRKIVQDNRKFYTQKMSIKNSYKMSKIIDGNMFFNGKKLIGILNNKKSSSIYYYKNFDIIKKTRLNTLIKDPKIYYYNDNIIKCISEGNIIEIKDGEITRKEIKEIKGFPIPNLNPLKTITNHATINDISGKVISENDMGIDALTLGVFLSKDKIKNISKEQDFYRIGIFDPLTLKIENSTTPFKFSDKDENIKGIWEEDEELKIMTINEDGCFFYHMDKNIMF